MKHKTVSWQTDIKKLKRNYLLLNKDVTFKIFLMLYLLFSVCKFTLEEILIKSITTVITAIMHSGLRPGFIDLEK